MGNVWALLADDQLPSSAELEVSKVKKGRGIENLALAALKRNSLLLFRVNLHCWAVNRVIQDKIRKTVATETGLSSK